MTFFILLRFGRRIPYASFMIIGGAAEMLVLAVPSGDGKLSFQVVLISNRTTHIVTKLYVAFMRSERWDVL